MSTLDTTDCKPVNGFINFDENGNSVICNGFIDFDSKGNAIIIDAKNAQSAQSAQSAESIESIESTESTESAQNAEPIYKSIINPNININEEKENDNYKCDICNKTFIKKDYYKRHMLSHNDAFTCHICSKKFFHGYHLKQHMDFHKEVRDYKCDICDFTARFKTNLIKHKKTHIKYYDIKTDTYKYI